MSWRPTDPSPLPTDVGDFLRDAAIAIGILLEEPETSVRKISIRVQKWPQGHALIEQTWSKPKAVTS